MLDVSILIVNYNTADLIQKCIQSVLDQKNCRFEIIVIDNASHDDSVNVLQTLQDKIHFVANKENIGFGRANNQAFHISQGRYLFLLNPDAELTSDHDLYEAVQYMEQNPQCGLFGTKVLDSQLKITDSASFHYPRQKQTSADFSHLPGEWATVLGASMFVRRDVYQKVNGFDEDFFLYAEETDLCLRIRQAGYWIGYYEKIAVKHIGGASENKNPPEEVMRKKKKGKYLFYSKHYPKADVLKLVKDDFKHAKFQLFRLGVMKRFWGLNKDQLIRYARHKVSVEVAQDFLSCP